RDTQDDVGVELLRGQQDAFGPLQIVDVELAYGIVAVARFQQHIGSIYQHITYLHILLRQTRRAPGRAHTPSMSLVSLYLDFDKKATTFFRRPPAVQMYFCGIFCQARRAVRVLWIPWEIPAFLPYIFIALR